MERVLSVKFATTSLGKLSASKSVVVTKSGRFPFGYFVMGKLELETPGMLTPPPVPKLAENCARETGKRSPTKNVAGRLSPARSKIRRPGRPREKMAET